jgi:prepilin signal peptidase PulO-like enzyme (type II secretory pathway)
LTPFEQVAVIALSAYLVVVALLIGSFINLAADRLPRGESIVRPRSHCRSCGRVLNVVDLIPVGGYIIRGGRCASCGASIGLSSPVVEALCGGTMLASVALLGPWLGAGAGFAAMAIIGMAAIGASFGRRRRATRESQQGSPSGVARGPR